MHRKNALPPRIRGLHSPRGRERERGARLRQPERAAAGAFRTRYIEMVHDGALMEAKKHLFLATKARRQGMHLLGSSERRARFKPVDEIRLVLAHGAGGFRHRETEGISIPILGGFQCHGALQQDGDLLEQEASAVEIVPDGA